MFTLYNFAFLIRYLSKYSATIPLGRIARTILLVIISILIFILSALLGEVEPLILSRCCWSTSSSPQRHLVDHRALDDFVDNFFESFIYAYLFFGTSLDEHHSILTCQFFSLCLGN